MWRSAWSVVGAVIGGECCEWFGGRVVMAVVTECWFGVVNPTRRVGCV